MTVFLTTHNIEEANFMCDRVAIINQGKIVAIDRPENLRNAIQSSQSVEVAFDKPITDLKKMECKDQKFVLNNDKFKSKKDWTSDGNK